MVDPTFTYFPTLHGGTKEEGGKKLKSNQIKSNLHSLRTLNCREFAVVALRETVDAGAGTQKTVLGPISNPPKKSCVPDSQPLGFI